MSGDRVVVRTPIAPLLVEPRASATQVSQVLHGHSASVLFRDGAWIRVTGADDYEGWLHEGYVVTRDDPATPAWGWDAAGEMSLGCSIRDEQGATLDLPLGALLGRSRRISGRSLDFANRRDTFPRESEAVVASAMGLFQGTYYQWGGLSPWGADCSGMVQSTFALHGIRLPRDAWQQAGAGTLVEGGIEAVKSADLLFFSDRADAGITHVAISTGSRGIVHAALGRGGFALERLDKPDDYSRALAARFRFARRIIP
ncbi:MAG: SH3 domain-containing C40 family peptidase [Longimicrobiales bacterium]